MFVIIKIDDFKLFGKNIPKFQDTCIIQLHFNIHSYPVLQISTFFGKIYIQSFNIIIDTLFNLFIYFISFLFSLLLHFFL